MVKIMKIGICEDSIEEQTQYLNCFQKLGYSDIAVFNSGEELLEKMPSLDLLFLDIEMDKISGIQIKNIFEEKKKNTYIVFYTKHTEVMQEGFGANVLGFIYKPITLHEIKLYIDKTSIKLEQNYPVYINNNTYVSSDDILYIEADHNYTVLYMADNYKNLVRKSIDNWLTELAPCGFIRIHRSYIVNMYNINHIDTSSIILVNGHRLNISRKMLSTTKEAFENFQLKLFNKSLLY